MMNPTLVRIQMVMKGIRVTEVAKAAGVSKSAISQVMAGKVRPTARVKKAFADLGIDLEVNGRG